MTIGGWVIFAIFAILVLCFGIAGAYLIENIPGKIISVVVADSGDVLRHALVLPEYCVWPAGPDRPEK